MDKDNNVRTLMIADIVRDPRFQVRVGKPHDATVAAYAANYRVGTIMPPVGVAMLNGVPMLYDGWHRMEALERIGGWKVEASITTVQDEAGVYALAAMCNITHGLALKKRDKVRVFRAYVRGRRHRQDNGKLKSYRTIGRELGGVSHQTIMRWMRESFPAVAKLYGQQELTERRLPGMNNPNDTFADTARKALDAALAAARGVTDEDARRQLAEHAKGVFESIAAGEPWSPPDLDTEDF